MSLILYRRCVIFLMDKLCVYVKEIFKGNSFTWSFIHYTFLRAAERKQSLGYDWHPECLRCEECGKRLNPGQHAEVKALLSFFLYKNKFKSCIRH